MNNFRLQSMINNNLTRYNVAPKNAARITTKIKYALSHIPHPPLIIMDKRWTKLLLKHTFEQRGGTLQTKQNKKKNKTKRTKINSQGGKLAIPLAQKKYLHRQNLSLSIPDKKNSNLTSGKFD